MPWLSEIDSPKPSVITKFIAAKSGKGFILETPDYSCFCWNSDKLAIQLSEALAVFSESHSTTALLIVPNKAEKRGFVVDKAKPVESKKYGRQWFLRADGYVYDSEQEGEKNPFLE